MVFVCLFTSTWNIGKLSLIKCHVCEMSEKGPKMLLKAPDTEGNTGGGGASLISRIIRHRLMKR